MAKADRGPVSPEMRAQSMKEVVNALMVGSTDTAKAALGFTDYDA